MITAMDDFNLTAPDYNKDLQQGVCDLDMSKEHTQPTIWPNSTL